MLSGIRKGKKKKPKTVPQKFSPTDQNVTDSTSLLSERRRPTTSRLENQNVADQLRQSLKSGNSPSAVRSKGEDEVSKMAASTWSSSSSSLMDRLERGGRITTVDKDTENPNTTTSATIVVDFINSKALSSSKSEDDMNIQELVANERAAVMGTISLDEQMARNVARIGKKRRRKMGVSNGDSDEEIERMNQLFLPHTATATATAAATGALTRQAQQQSKAMEKHQQRDRHRQLAEHYQQTKITSKCSWWLESSSFLKYRLLALGNHVSLVMAPTNAALIPGHHFYLVPIKHAESLVSCHEDDKNTILHEIGNFRTSLQNFYAQEKKGVILMETVLPNKGFWQTRMEVIPVPFSVLQDAPIYFKSSMMEQAEEWGVHNKVLSTSKQKPLHTVIPTKQGFPYFYVEWGNVSTSNATGYVQIIEATNFRYDFGLDTVASMMELDPIRLQRKAKFSQDEEKRNIQVFLQKWKSFDWTLQLDG